MKSNSFIKCMAGTLMVLIMGSCKIAQLPVKIENKSVPNQFTTSIDTINSAKTVWGKYFRDTTLVALIDTALSNNQELNMIRQELNIASYEIRARRGEYLPMGVVKAGVGPDKAGRYTWNGQSEEALKANPGDAPKYIGDFGVSAFFSWELDVWKKLRNAKKSAVERFLASIEGRNFMITHLIAEIAHSYYELLALDNQLGIIRENIAIQQNALDIIRQQKEAARVTQLAVTRFEAQLLNTQNLQYDIQQQIVETENRINFLIGRFPQPILRNDASFNSNVFNNITSGIPAQLLENRPDIRQAERELAATKLDIKVAKANFMPNFSLSATVGFQAFNPSVWVNPTSIIYSFFGDMIAPLVNRNAIIAMYNTSSAKQIQAVYHYEQTILNAYTEVLNQLASIDNYTKSYETKSREVTILTQAVSISDLLFKSARADYLEVLLTQREALASKMELIEIKQKQLNAQVSIFQALGGGWR